MDVYKTHGAFSWSELLTTNTAKASEFYGTLFGWKVEAMDMGAAGSYLVAKVGAQAVAGMMAAPAPGMPSMWGCYVTVDDVDATVANCKALGGGVAMEPMVVPGVGRMACLRDPQGATLSVIKYDADMK